MTQKNRRDVKGGFFHGQRETDAALATIAARLTETMDAIRAAADLVKKHGASDRRAKGGTWSDFLRDTTTTLTVDAATLGAMIAEGRKPKA